MTAPNRTKRNNTIPLKTPLHAATTHDKFWAEEVFSIVGTDEHTEIVSVTPNIARAWLARNTSNRKIQPDRVRLYAEAIRNGTWEVHGQGLTFSKEGVLLDGQHRLNAIIDAGMPARLSVFLGARQSAVDGIDAGQERSNGQRMMMAFPDMRNPQAVASIARTILVGTRISGHIGKVGFQDILDTYGRFRAGIDYAKDHLSSKPAFKRSPVLAAAAIAYTREPYKIEHLFERASSPEGHVKGDIALTLRQYVLTHTGGRGVAIRDVMGRVLRACKAAVEGESLILLKEDQSVWKFFGLAD